MMNSHESPAVHPTALFSRAAERAGGIAIRGAEDYDLWLRAWSAGLTFAKVLEPCRRGVIARTG
jgi:hypothetical protein